MCLPDMPRTVNARMVPMSGCRGLLCGDPGCNWLDAPQTPPALLRCGLTADLGPHRRVAWRRKDHASEGASLGAPDPAPDATRVDAPVVWPERRRRPPGHPRGPDDLGRPRSARQWIWSHLGLRLLVRRGAVCHPVIAERAGAHFALEYVHASEAKSAVGERRRGGALRRTPPST